MIWNLMYLGIVVAIVLYGFSSLWKGHGWRRYLWIGTTALAVMLVSLSTFYPRALRSLIRISGTADTTLNAFGTVAEVSASIASVLASIWLTKRWLDGYYSWPRFLVFLATILTPAAFIGISWISDVLQPLSGRVFVMTVAVNVFKALMITSAAGIPVLLIHAFLERKDKMHVVEPPPEVVRAVVDSTKAFASSIEEQTGESLEIDQRVNELPVCWIAGYVEISDIRGVMKYLRIAAFEGSTNRRKPARLYIFPEAVEINPKDPDLTAEKYKAIVPPHLTRKMGNVIKLFNEAGNPRSYEQAYEDILAGLNEPWEFVSSFVESKYRHER